MLLGLPLTNRAIDPLAFPPLSVIDLLIFLSALFPTLIRAVAPSILLRCLVSTISYGLTLPFVVLLPRLGLTSSPYPWPADEQPSLLQDICIHLVRHAFRNFPHTIGRVFFSEAASVPLMRARFRGRMDRYCTRVDEGGVHGWWIAPGGAQVFAEEGDEKPDVVLMYLHGGGLTMGAPAFYLHFLALLAAALRARGFSRPAIFAPSYGLAPETKHPEQREAVRRSWEYVLRKAEGTQIGVGGDSAGGLHTLSLLLGMSEGDQRPDFVTLISPWTSLRPIQSDDAASHPDFVDPLSLKHFARLASGAQPWARSPAPLASLLFPSHDEVDPLSAVREHTRRCADDPLLCPGDASAEQWARALAGVSGVLVTYGSSETLAPQAHAFVTTLREIQAKRAAGGMRIEDVPVACCHAPPVVWAFLGRDERERKKGVDVIARFVQTVLAG